jgi:hypothetical protein
MPRRRVRRSVVGLALAATLLGVGTGALHDPVDAQDGAAQTGDQLFGSYDLEARGVGVQTRYEIEGLLPGGAPVLDLTIPETLARFGSGPTGYGLASLLYPGGIIVNLSSLVAQAGTDASNIPDYPVKAEAFYPAGPLDAKSQAIGDQEVRTNELGVDAMGIFPSIDANPAISVASVTSASRSGIEDGKAVSRTRVVLGGVNLLGGVISIDSLVTDLVAVHDGTKGAVNGGTTASGVRFLGLAASLTDDGLVLDDAPPVQGPGAPLGTVLTPAIDGLQQLTAPVQDLVEQVLDQAVPSLDDVLAAAGIHLTLLTGEDVVTDSGASAFRTAGLALTLSYKGAEQEGLIDLIESIPPDLRPNLGPLPNPVSFLANNHITGLTLGLGTVSALASSPFDTEGGDTGDLPLDGGLPPFDVGELGDPGFSTPLPEISEGSQPVGLGDTAAAAASGAIPAGLIILVLLLSPFFGVASTRLADNVLAGTSSSCPSGLDEPPPRTRAD